LRAEFEVYNLLFYLTVRAGQLGLNVGHVPVIRRYPHDGKVPTKIGGFASKLALLGETVRAATGGYTPDHAAPQNVSLLWSALLTAALLLPLLASVIVSPNYSPDSWALYELSQTVFADFYRFTHFRSYANASEYSAAFAPLWPILIAVVDGALGTGARTGVYLAFLAYFAFAVVSEEIGRQVTGAAWVGMGAAMVLLLGSSMVWDELSAGRTIPLQLLLYALLLKGLLVGRSMAWLKAGSIGLIAGLAVMNRFDAALLPIFAAAIVGWITRSPARVGVAFAASVAALLPWIGYSLVTFGTLFATDNAGIATSLDPRAFVTDWWPESQPSIADNPASWVSKVLVGAGQWIINGLVIVASPLGAAIALAVVAMAGVQLLASKAPSLEERPAGLPKDQQILIAFVGVMILMMVPQVVTGYLEYRYYSALIWAFILAASVWLIGRAGSRAEKQIYGSIIWVFFLPWIVGFVLLTLVGAARDGRIDTQRWAAFEAPQDVSQLSECLTRDQDARVLVLGDERFVAKAGALGALRAMMEPRNISDDRPNAPDWDAFFEAWQVDYVLVGDPSRMNDGQSLAGAQIVANCPLPLFKIGPSAAGDLR